MLNASENIFHANWLYKDYPLIITPHLFFFFLHDSTVARKEKDFLWNIFEIWMRNIYETQSIRRLNKEKNNSLKQLKLTRNRNVSAVL